MESDASENLPGFWGILFEPYQGRSLLPLAVMIPALCGFIAYTWNTQTPIEYLHWLPENLGAILLLANIAYACALFLKAAWYTLKSMRIRLQIIELALKETRGERHPNDPPMPRLSVRQKLRLAIPVVHIFCHLFLMLLFCLPSSLLMNAPYIS